MSTILDKFVDFLATTRAPAGLFSKDVAATIFTHGGHYTVETPKGLEEELARSSPKGYRVKVVDREITPRGFVVQFTQTTPDGLVYEEMVWAIAKDGALADLKWHCTGVAAMEH